LRQDARAGCANGEADCNGNHADIQFVHDASFLNSLARGADAVLP